MILQTLVVRRNDEARMTNDEGGDAGAGGWGKAEAERIGGCSALPLSDLHFFIAEPRLSPCKIAPCPCIPPAWKHNTVMQSPQIGYFWRFYFSPRERGAVGVV